MFNDYYAELYDAACSQMWDLLKEIGIPSPSEDQDCFTLVARRAKELHNAKEANVKPQNN